MPVKKTVLESLLREGFPDAQIHIEDTMDDEDHYAVTLVTSTFEGLRLVQRHQKVYAALGGLMKQELHALSLKTLTPGEAS